MTVSRRLRFEILRRDNHTCRYCGAQAPDVELTVDHVIPVALGGGDEPANLVTACEPCNSGKSSVPADAAIVEDVDATAFLFAQAMERASERRREEIADLDAVIEHFDHAVWGDWNWGKTDEHPEGTPLPRPAAWRDSIERFLANGLDANDLARLTQIAMESKARTDRVWRYFCGCCWNEISRRQELARQMIEDGEV